MSTKPMINRKLYLLAEVFTLFILLPSAILFFQLHKFFILILWIFAFLCFSYLKKDKDFDQKSWTRKEAINQNNLKRILLIFLLATILISIYTYIFEPARFMQFPLTNPVLWGIVMVLYPILSVYPQEIIYRAFFLHRYKAIFRSQSLLIISSAASFGYAHIIFHNFIAVFLSFIGGILFGLNYRKNKSLLLVSLEHALYGCMIFTVGLGWYFYRGSVGIN